MAAMKAELGANAVILHSKKYREGGFLGLGSREIVEITAAVEESSLPQKDNRPTPTRSKVPPKVLSSYKTNGTAQGVAKAEKKAEPVKPAPAVKSTPPPAPKTPPAQDFKDVLRNAETIPPVETKPQESLPKRKSKRVAAFTPPKVRLEKDKSAEIQPKDEVAEVLTPQSETATIESLSDNEPPIEDVPQTEPPISPPQFGFEPPPEELPADEYPPEEISQEPVQQNPAEFTPEQLAQVQSMMMAQFNQMQMQMMQQAMLQAQTQAQMQMQAQSQAQIQAQELQAQIQQMHAAQMQQQAAEESFEAEQQFEEEIEPEVSPEQTKIRRLEDEIAQMKALLAEVVGRDTKKGTISLHEALRLQEVNEEILNEMATSGTAGETLVDSKSSSARWTLATYIGEHLKFSEGIKLNRLGSRIVALLGTTGVGKTTTLAKIAAKFVLEQGIGAALITADTYRISAVDQLKTYSDILGLPLEIVYTPEELNAAIEKHKSKELILIDTAGRSQHNNYQMRELADFLNVNSRIEKHLVISATTKFTDAKEIIKKFNTANPERVIITKVDETGSLGMVINLLRNEKLALSYITTGQSVPDDIEVANADVLTDLVMKKAAEWIV